jgi:two-component system, NarL family, response regulator NreC
MSGFVQHELRAFISSHPVQRNDMSRPQADRHSGADGRPVRVVLVDDHPLLRAGVKLLLSGEGDIDVVAEADNGLAAVQIAQEVSADVIVMDLSLPELSGAEATRQILATQPALRVLALSTHEDVAFARMMLEAGALGYVLKRSAPDELVRALRVVATGGTYIDPALAGSMIGGRTPLGSPSSDGMPIANLSQREAEVVRMTAQGHTSKEMAKALGLSARTLETYKARAMGKLNLHSRADLVRYALRCGWLHDP